MEGGQPSMGDKNNGNMETDILEMLKKLRPTCKFEECTDFIKERFLDSFDIVALISDLEERYNVSISALDTIPANFRTVKAIHELVERSTGNNINSK